MNSKRLLPKSRTCLDAAHPPSRNEEKLPCTATPHLKLHFFRLPFGPSTPFPAYLWSITQPAFPRGVGSHQCHRPTHLPFPTYQTGPRTFSNPSTRSVNRLREVKLVTDFGTCPYDRYAWYLPRRNLPCKARIQISSLEPAIAITTFRWPPPSPFRAITMDEPDIL